ncbi:MAG: UDP-N-acetylmuramoyl-tripeptide--D-alanyl-D-alanine ligase [Bacteroidales bacterium]|nr:UDP-N-acetylmuramoyl-tripeptide--D-alanyl-D-alanine ligase [Bacteroidales bacterium]
METEQLYKIFKQSSGVVTDSRIAGKGQIFFALRGYNYDGNKFASDALQKGASWAVIDDPLFKTEKTILVDDCLNELQSLALHHREEMNIPVLAITGTNGKTTTKELIASVLSKKYKVHYTRGNLNNHIGVPLTILSAPAATEMMIIEMGASHIGEISRLCMIAKPDYGIITNIGTAHIEGFGSVDGIVKAKTELYEFLQTKNGTVLYNDQNQILKKQILRIGNKALPFSEPAGTELIVKVLSHDLNLKLTAAYNNQTYNICTHLFGRYNIENIKAAIATGLFLGVEIRDVIDAIENYQPANNRSQVRITKNNTLICDAYNANPTSMHSSLESFAGVQSDSKLVILGDMLELGEKSEEEHIKLLNELQSFKIRKVFLVGSVFRKVSPEYGFRSFSDVDDLMKFLKSEPVKGDTILIKGSRGIGLEKIYDLL